MPVRHVYVHVPFCARRCTYCDFSIAVRRDVPAAAFAREVLAEVGLRHVAGGELDTLYLGGGTPSRLGGEGVARLVGSLREAFPLAAGAEVTLEANPEDVTPAAAAIWAAAGVNRVSLGVQSFDAGVLAWMHRSHGEAQVQSAVEALRAAGIGNLSLDLIYALPAHLERDWGRDLDLALRLAPSHLSCYGLTVEGATPLGRRVARREVLPAGEEAHEGEFLAADTTLTASGFEHYEVSNYGLPGLQSRHNAAYWGGAAYLGLGPSAHGYDGSRRRWNEAAYAAWRARIHRGEDPVGGEEELGETQRALEQAYLDLRTLRGVVVSEANRPTLERWEAVGWAIRQGDRVVLTPRGWLRLDALVAALTP